MTVDQAGERVGSLHPQGNRRLHVSLIHSAMCTRCDAVVSAKASRTFTLAVELVAGSAVEALKRRQQTVETSPDKHPAPLLATYHGGQSSGLSS